MYMNLRLSSPAPVGDMPQSILISGPDGDHEVNALDILNRLARAINALEALGYDMAALSDSLEAKLPTGPFLDRKTVNAHLWKLPILANAFKVQRRTFGEQLDALHAVMDDLIDIYGMAYLGSCQEPDEREPRPDP